MSRPSSARASPAADGGGELAAAAAGKTPTAAAAQPAAHLTAFAVEAVLHEPRLMCMEVWSSYLLAGLADGTLLLLSASASPRSSPGTPPAAPLPWTATQTLRGFGRRHILQLGVARQRSMLLCLAGAHAMRGGARGGGCARAQHRGRRAKCSTPAAGPTQTTA